MPITTKPSTILTAAKMSEAEEIAPGKAMHGGKRAGAGRHFAGNISVTVRIREDQKKLFYSLGGSSFLQHVLDEIYAGLLKSNKEHNMTYTIGSVLDACKAAPSEKIKALFNRLTQKVFVLDENQEIKEYTVLDVLNKYSAVVNTPRGPRFEFFYEDGELRKWQDGHVKAVEKTDALSGHLKLIQFAITDLDNNAAVTWSWDRKDLEELVEEME